METLNLKNTNGFYLSQTDHTKCAVFVWFISHQQTILVSQNKPATINQTVVLLSQNKSAPAISHQPNEHAECLTSAIVLYDTITYRLSTNWLVCCTRVQQNKHDLWLHYPNEK
jgi:hypothetical protein